MRVFFQWKFFMMEFFQWKFFTREFFQWNFSWWNFFNRIFLWRNFLQWNFFSGNFSWWNFFNRIFLWRNFFRLKFFYEGNFLNFSWIWCAALEDPIQSINFNRLRIRPQDRFITNSFIPGWNLENTKSQSHLDIRFCTGPMTRNYSHWHHSRCRQTDRRPLFSGWNGTAEWRLCTGHWWLGENNRRTTLDNTPLPRSPGHTSASGDIHWFPSKPPRSHWTGRWRPPEPGLYRSGTNHWAARQCRFWLTRERQLFRHTRWCIPQRCRNYSRCPDIRRRGTFCKFESSGRMPTGELCPGMVPLPQASGIQKLQRNEANQSIKQSIEQSIK